MKTSNNLIHFRLITEEDYNDLVRFVAQYKHSKALHESKKDVISVWSAGDDNDNEGIFLNYFTNQPLPDLPWAMDRPSISTVYNYLTSYIHMNIINSSHVEVAKSEVFDVPATWYYYPVCAVKAK